MITKMIKIDSVSKVKNFVSAVSTIDADFDLVSGRYVIDAKSIMGVFSLNLCRPIEMRVHADDESKVLAQCNERLSDFFVV